MGGRGPRETAPRGPRGPACPARSPPEGRGATCTNNPGGHAGGRHSLEPGGDPGPRAPGAGVARGPRAGDCVPSRPACGFDRASGGRSLCPSWRDRSPRHHGGRSVTVTLPHALQTPFFPSRPRPGGRPPPSLCVRAPQEGARAPGERSGSALPRASVRGSVSSLCRGTWHRLALRCHRVCARWLRGPSRPAGGTCVFEGGPCSACLALHTGMSEGNVPNPHTLPNMLLFHCC